MNKPEEPTIQAFAHNIIAFKKGGLKILQTLSEAMLSEIIKEANNQFHNVGEFSKQTPLLTDNEYDIIKEYMERTYPKNPVLSMVGSSTIISKNKAVLPYEMASMDKIKPDSDALSNWISTYSGPYIISCKLDGVSGLYTTEDATQPKLYTRGDGKVGQDISHLIPYLKLPKNKGLTVRGEFILPKAVFESKYKATFANARNLVAGIVNRQTLDKDTINIIRDIHFVTYEVITPVLKPSDQLSFLYSNKTPYVVQTVTDTLVSNNYLSTLLINWRKNYSYEIDGVIVTNDKVYKRTSGNPKHAFAFKMVLSDQVAEAKVVDVIWSPSKDGYLKPRVQIEPIKLGGVTIEYATGFNAAFIEQHKLGVGALIQIIRSGDVIPHIKSVIQPAAVTCFPDIPYIWNDTHVDIMLEDMNVDMTVRKKVLTAFFQDIGVDGLGAGNITKIMDNGYNTIPKIIHMSLADFQSIKGFNTLADKFHQSISEQVGKASLLTLMSASNIFGRGIGERKIEPILAMYPDILTSNRSYAEKVQLVSQVKGIAQKSAELFVSNIPVFIQFMKDIGKQVVSNKKQEATVAVATSPLYQKRIVMTGFRDSVLEKELTALGAIIGSSISKTTFVLLVKDTNVAMTGKVGDAKNLNVPIMTVDAFKKMYMMCM